MVNINRFSVGTLQTNCYFISENNHCIIVDPGDSADFLLEELQRRNLVLDAIIATHGHFDHVMAVGEIQSSYPVPFYIHPDDLFLLKRLKSTVKHFIHTPVPILPIVSNFELHEGELSIGAFESLHVIHTPGHTPGSCCITVPSEQVIFSGDTLFKEGIGRYDHSYGSKQLLKQSINKLSKLEDVYKLYPGHGEDSLLHLEIEYALTLI